jgi:hypothetical protein
MSVGIPSILTKLLRGFPQYFQANYVTAVPKTSTQMYYHLDIPCNIIHGT